MKTLFRSLLFVLGLFAATMAFAAVPPITVTVFSATGTPGFKGVTDSKGAFTTSNLPAGNYTVQFNANSAAVKGHNYSIVVSAGKKKVQNSAVAGEKFNGGGVAMKVAVGSNSNISGQVAETAKAASDKKMVWIPPMLGSNRPGHWAEEGSAEAIESRTRSMTSKDPTATGGVRY